MERLPPAHYKFQHKYFPSGQGIPCRVSACEIKEVGEDVGLFLTLSYGPFLKVSKPKVKGIVYSGNEPAKFIKKSIPKKVETVISEKRIEIVYYSDEYYDLIKLFTNFGIDHSQVRYPEQLSDDVVGKKSDFAPIKEVFDNFFIPHKYKVFVDVDNYYDNNLMRAFIFATSKIRKNRKS
jgi:hypothetical protein